MLFRSEVMALEVLEKAKKLLEERKVALQKISKTLVDFSDGTPADRARLEMARDERLRELQNEERRYQIAKEIGRASCRERV